MTRGGLWGRILYGALFLALLPAVLVRWARATAGVIPLDPLYSLPAGLALILAGSILLLLGGSGLIRHGRGLPMNAFPPPVHVRQGVYRWLRNPMYLGFALVVLGVALLTGSPSGLWLVTPMTGLAALALVWGYERHDLVARFGPSALDPPLLSLARDRDGPPTGTERIATYLWVLLPWLVAYASVQALGRASDAFGTSLPFEAAWPVWQWTEAVYASTYLFIPLTPLLVSTATGLHRFALQGALATAFVTLCWVTIPVVAENRPFIPDGLWGRLLAFEQGSSRGVAAFPAFHILWSLLAAEAWSGNTGAGRSRAWRWIGWSWAALIALSCLTTGMHTLIEAAAAGLTWLPLRRPERTWAAIRDATERFANSWREWRLGPVRVINHGIWAAAGAGLGVVIAGSAAGSGRYPAIPWLGVAVLAGAGLWAQALEGSTRLLRPFGWYGGVIGGVAGAVLIRLFTDIPLLPLLGSLAVAAPWIQAFGRMRCLIQGCCHGGPAGVAIGIRYRHPRSRVTQLAGLSRIPIHPTPLYSIAGNLILGILLLRLRSLGTGDALLLGLYLMLAGVARFVEESYRAEPQTPIVGRLRIYQWFALGSIAAGMLCTTLPSEAGHRPLIAPPARLLWSALGIALLYGAAMGIDFPGSNRRFSRLAPSE